MFKFNCAQSTLNSLTEAGVHEEKIFNKFSGDVFFQKSAENYPNPLFLILFTNRSGSNLLADYLRQTKLIGGFNESLNFDTVEKFSNKNNINSFPDYFKTIYNNQCVKRRFGLKSSLDQMMMMRKWGAFNIFPKIYVVHIHRLDIIAQAVSHSIAAQTHQWTSNQKMITNDVSFNYDTVDNLVSHIIRTNSLITLASNILGFEYISIAYEELCYDPILVIERILKKFEIDRCDINLSSPKIERQYSSINDEHIRLYKDLAINMFNNFST